MPRVGVAFVVLLWSALAAGATLDEQLVGRWRLDEASGAIANDASGSGLDCTLDRATRVAGHTGGAIKLDGSGSVRCGQPPSLALTGALTIGAWVRVDDARKSIHMRIASKKARWDAANGYELELNPVKKTITLTGSGRNNAVANWAIGAGWHHVAGVIDGATGRIYVDGVERTTDRSLDRLVAGTTAFVIGRGAGGAGGFIGALDEVTVHARALDASEIPALMSGVFDAPNRPPVTSDQSLVTTRDTPVDVTLAASDPEGDPLTWRVSEPPAHGAISGTAPTFTYLPTAGFTGVDDFACEVSDGRGGTATARVHVAVSPPPTPTDPDALVAWWRLDEGAGATATDASGLGHACALTAPRWVPGHEGEALQLATGAWGACGHPSGLALTSAFTVAAWVMVANPGESAYMRIVSKKQRYDAATGFALSYNPGRNKLELLGGGTSAAVAIVDLDGGWHHLAAAVQGTSVNLYVDGARVASGLRVNAVQPGTTDLYLGRDAGGASPFHGALDDVRLYGRALSDAEVAGLLPPPPPPGPPAAWLEGATTKLRPQQRPREQDAIELVAARNEFVAFQVAVHGGGAGVEGVQPTFSGLLGPAAIDGARITMYRETLLTLQYPSIPGEPTGTWPDGLVPAIDEIAGEPRNAFPFDVPREQTRAIWVDVHVPPDAPPGRYAGEVRVTGGGLDVALAVVLEVVDATLPSTTAIASAFHLFLPSMCVAHFQTDCDDLALRDTLGARYRALALDHRVSISNVGTNNKGVIDWTAFEATVGPFLDGTAPTRLSGARLTSIRFAGQHTVEGYRDFADHLRNRGDLDRAFLYVVDEPPYNGTWEDGAARARMARDAAPDLRTLVTTSIDEVAAQGLTDLIDLLVPTVNWLDGTREPYLGDQRGDYDAFLTRAGTGLWTYQSCNSHGCNDRNATAPSDPTARWPSYMIDAPAGRNRAMQWAAFLADVSGELYFEMGSRLATAWTDQYAFGGNGDGTLFYPGTPAVIGGTTDVPLPSIRLKLIRQGFQDLEWLKLVAAAGDPEGARAIARTVVPKASQVSDDPAAWDAARRALLDRWLELTAPPAP